MDQSSNIHLNWNNHQATLVSAFDALLYNEKLTDCTVSAEGQHISAHKIILSACSPYFEELFTKNFEAHPILILHDVKYDVVKGLIDFMYHGEVIVPQKELSGLLKLSEALQIRGLCGSGCVDDADLEGGCGRDAPSVSPETLRSEPASAQRIKSEHNEPEQNVQTFSGCNLTVSSEEGHSMEIGSILGGPNVTELQTSESECGELTCDSIVAEKGGIPVPETVLIHQMLATTSARREEVPLKTKSEFGDSHIDVVDIDDDDEGDDDDDYRDNYTNAQPDIQEGSQVNEDLTCGGNFLTLGLNSLQSLVDNVHLNNMTTSSPSESHYRYVCPNCGKCYQYSRGLRRHLKLYCGKKEPQFQCPRCKKRCWRFDNLKVHMASNRCKMHDVSSTRVDSMNTTEQWS